MSTVDPFHSINESRSPSPRYHTDNTCERARQIPSSDYRPGSGGYYHCETCRAMPIRRFRQQGVIARDAD